MIIAAWVFMALAVIGIGSYIGAWVYDHNSGYNSPRARKLGFLVAMPLAVVFFVVSIVFFDQAAPEDEPSTKVTIECEIGDDSNLTCEVLK